MPEVTDRVLHAAGVIWDYLQLRHTPIPGDLIVALGTNDLRVAEFAADLFHRGYGKLLLCTGGIAHQDDLLATPWNRSEAEMYADVAVSHGVPRECILLETSASNTAENLRFARRLVCERKLSPRNIVLCVKPFMQRRTWAHMAVEWPEMPATVASASMRLAEYFTPELSPELIIHIMMGDLQRMSVYGRRAWAAPQNIPNEVRTAFNDLKSAGFTHHLLAGEEGL